MHSNFILDGQSISVARVDQALQCPLCKTRTFLKRDSFIAHVQKCSATCSIEAEDNAVTDTEDMEQETEVNELSQSYLLNNLFYLLIYIYRNYLLRAY